VGRFDGLAALAVIVLLAGCAADAVPSPGVTTGCAMDDTAPNMLEELCSDPARYMSRRVVLSGDWEQSPALCTAAGCLPGTCCNDCSTSYALTCPDGRIVHMLRDQSLELPLIERPCASGAGCPMVTRLGCAGPAGTAETDCSADWRCTPEAATICAMAGAVISFDDTSIMLSVDAVDLTVAP